MVSPRTPMRVNSVGNTRGGRMFVARALLLLAPIGWLTLVVIDRVAFGLRDDDPIRTITESGKPGEYVDPIWPSEDVLMWDVVWAVAVSFVCAVAVASVGRWRVFWSVACVTIALPYALLLFGLWHQNPLTVIRHHTDAGTIEQDPGPFWYLPTRHVLFAALAITFVALVVLAVVAIRAERLRRRSRLSPDGG